MKRIKQGEGQEKAVTLYRAVKGSQDLKINLHGIWERSVPCRGNDTHKVPKVGTYLFVGEKQRAFSFLQEL